MKRREFLHKSVAGAAMAGSAIVPRRILGGPGHTHAVATMAAFKAGKHVYCEKPLAHDVHEARAMAEAARRSGLATQMGNQAHASYNYRRVVELIRAGAIGKVSQVHVWCNKTWPPNYRPKKTERPPVPENLDWDLWLGPAPYRPYHSTYHPFSWRPWWDFGNGMLGDMGCRSIDLAFWALGLKYAVSVEAERSPPGPQCMPPWLICRWKFPARVSFSRSDRSFRHVLKQGYTSSFHRNCIGDTRPLDAWRSGRLRASWSSAASRKSAR